MSLQSITTSSIYSISSIYNGGYLSVDQSSPDYNLSYTTNPSSSLQVQFQVAPNASEYNICTTSIDSLTLCIDIFRDNTSAPHLTTPGHYSGQQWTVTGLADPTNDGGTVFEFRNDYSGINAVLGTDGGEVYMENNISITSMQENLHYWQLEAVTPVIDPSTGPSTSTTALSYTSSSQTVSISSSQTVSDPSSQTASSSSPPTASTSSSQTVSDPSSQTTSTSSSDAVSSSSKSGLSSGSKIAIGIGAAAIIGFLSGPVLFFTRYRKRSPPSARLEPDNELQNAILEKANVAPAELQKFVERSHSSDQKFELQADERPQQAELLGN